MTAGVPLSRALVELLRLVAGPGADPVDVLRCVRHAGNALGPRTLDIRVCQLSNRFVPEALATRLETDAAAWSLGLAVRPALGKGITIGALTAVFHFNRVYEHPTVPGRLPGRQWLWPEAAIAEATARAASILPPSIVIDGRSRVVVLWGLTERLRVPASDAAVRRLLDRLAERVGAAVAPADHTLADLVIPLPGFVSQDATGAEERVVCRHLDPDARYSVDSLTAAIDAAPAGGPATPRAPRRARPEVSR